MIGADALRKLLYREEEEGDLSRRGYHYACVYDGHLSSAHVERPSAAMPRSGLKFATFCLASSFVGCATMKARNKEKWWVGLLFLVAGYYNVVKSHKVDNGLTGHQTGFWVAACGLVGTTARRIAGGGNRKFNTRMMCVFLGLMYYELGRFHMWTEYVSELRIVITPERSADLLRDFVPNTAETEFVNLRHVGDNGSLW